MSEDTPMTPGKKRITVKKGFSRSRDEKKAVGEFAQMVDQPDPCIVVFFISSKYDLKTVSAELRTRFDAPVIGCTTAGEISPFGYAEGTLSGFSIASDEISVILERA